MVGLIVHSTTPFNAETPLDRLRSNFVTPQRDFYVRSHGAVPSITSEAHRLRVDGRVKRKLDLSMRDLRTNFPTRTVMAVMQCAGNRRAELNRLRPVTGDPWAGGQSAMLPGPGYHWPTYCKRPVSKWVKRPMPAPAVWAAMPRRTCTSPSTHATRCRNGAARAFRFRWQKRFARRFCSLLK